MSIYRQSIFDIDISNRANLSPATCMASPSSTSCTDSDSGGANSLPATINNIDACMSDTEVRQFPCTQLIYRQANTCTKSYGATLVAAGGNGLVSWVQQLSKDVKEWILPIIYLLMFRETVSGAMYHGIGCTHLPEHCVQRADHRWLLRVQKLPADHLLHLHTD